MRRYATLNGNQYLFDDIKNSLNGVINLLTTLKASGRRCIRDDDDDSRFVVKKVSQDGQKLGLDYICNKLYYVSRHFTRLFYSYQDCVGKITIEALLKDLDEIYDRNPKLYAPLRKYKNSIEARLPKGNYFDDADFRALCFVYMIWMETRMGTIMYIYLK